MITLYDCATAPSPRRARILLAEKGVVHQTVEVDLRNGEQLSDAYRKLNPQCTVPALRTDEGLLLTDNAAITAYLEARYPQPPLLGERWLRLSEHRSSFDKWSPAGLGSVQSCPRRRAGVACDECTTDAVGNSCSPFMLPV